MNERQANRLLGYPDDARLLIINADDFGVCHAVNGAILRTLKEGVVTSTSLMTPCPWAPHAMRLLRENPDIPFGVHLTVICDSLDYRWRPMAATGNVPSLVDEAGYFFHSGRIPEFLTKARLDELEVEFRTQIEAVRAARLRPTHLDWHILADGRRADVFEMALGLAREYGLAMRIHDRDRARKLQRQGLPTVDFDVLDSYHLNAIDKSARYVQLLRELPAGLTEWAVHPSLGDAEMQSIDPVGWDERRADLDFLISQQARDLVEEEGIVLLDYRGMQRLWTRNNE